MREKRFYVKILLVRNAAHDAESNSRWPVDSTGLSSVGLAQRLRLCNALGGESIRDIYASHMSRSIETIRPLALLKGLPITECSEFNGIGMGRCAGMSYAEARELVGDEEFDKVTTNPDPKKRYFPDGETLEELEIRARTKLSSIVHAGKKDGCAVICTHEEVIGALLCHITGMRLSRVWWWGGRLRPPLYANITELLWENNEWTLVHFGCTLHLEGS